MKLYEIKSYLLLRHGCLKQTLKLYSLYYIFIHESKPIKPADETLFQYIIFFLREIVKNSATNGTSPEFLAELFSNAILRPEKHAQRKTGN